MKKLKALMPMKEPKLTDFQLRNLLVTASKLPRNLVSQFRTWGGLWTYLQEEGRLRGLPPAERVYVARDRYRVLHEARQGLKSTLVQAVEQFEDDTQMAYGLVSDIRLSSVEGLCLLVVAKDRDQVLEVVGRVTPLNLHLYQKRKAFVLVTQLSSLMGPPPLE